MDGAEIALALTFVVVTFAFEEPNIIPVELVLPIVMIPMESIFGVTMAFELVLFALIFPVETTVPFITVFAEVFPIVIPVAFVPPIVNAPAVYVSSLVEYNDALYRLFAVKFVTLTLEVFTILDDLPSEMLVALAFPISNIPEISKTGVII